MSHFFQTNRDIFFFIYGLVFFIMGIAILLQTRHSSRLDLARSLVWLALFGIAHGLNEWGDLFIPRQASYLPESTINLLYITQLIVLALSFTFLLEFGVTMLNPLGLGRWMHGLSVVLFLTWMTVVFFILSALIPRIDTWRAIGNALSRYFICLPGGLIAAYGLRQQTMLRIAPLNVPRIVSNLKIAGILIAFYAVLAGAIPPTVPFFPGNVINTQSFMAQVGIPVLVFRSVIALIMTVTIINGLEIFDLETQRRIEALEQQQIISAERERLARDLHDGAIQKVYTAGLLVESASRAAEPGSELAGRINKAVVVLNDAIADLRINLAELHGTSSKKDPEPLSEFFFEIANDPHYTSLVKIRLESNLPPDIRLSGLRNDHLQAIVKEAFANVARHAKAHHVDLKVIASDNKLSITIKDDGIGISTQQSRGFGLRNMQDRVRLLGGKIEISDNHGKGTIVFVEIPLMD